MRPSGRAPDQLRKVSLEPGFSRHAEGSCLVKFGDTHVLCTASVDEKVPPWMRNTQRGWVTAEYGMLPRSTHTRTDREAARGRQSGRTQEIQRLIGRALRAVVNLPAMGERQVNIDCDVLQADANFVLTGEGGIVEVQGTAEDKPFSEPQFMELLTLAKKGVAELTRLQRLAIGKS